MASSNNLNDADCHTTPFRCAVVEEAEQARLAAFSGQIWLCVRSRAGTSQVDSG